jgi:hypothetical protein
MARGKLVFDGPPAALTADVLRDIYGVNDGGIEVTAILESPCLQMPAKQDEELIPAAHSS